MDNKFLWIFDNFFSALPTIKNWGKFRGQASKLNYNVARNYIFYPMLVNQIENSDAPAEWVNQGVTQPVDALKSVDDGMGNRTVIEYQPSSWPTVWNSDGLPITETTLASKARG